MSSHPASLLETRDSAISRCPIFPPLRAYGGRPTLAAPAPRSREGARLAAARLNALGEFPRGGTVGSNPSPSSGESGKLPYWEIVDQVDALVDHRRAAPRTASITTSVASSAIFCSIRGFPPARRPPA